MVNFPINLTSLPDGVVGFAGSGNRSNISCAWLFWLGVRCSRHSLWRTRSAGRRTARMIPRGKMLDEPACYVAQRLVYFGPMVTLGGPPTRPRQVGLFVQLGDHLPQFADNRRAHVRARRKFRERWRESFVCEAGCEGSDDAV